MQAQRSYDFTQGDNGLSGPDAKRENRRLALEKRQNWLGMPMSMHVFTGQMSGRFSAPVGFGVGMHYLRRPIADVPFMLGAGVEWNYLGGHHTPYGNNHPRVLHLQAKHTYKSASVSHIVRSHAMHTYMAMRYSPLMLRSRWQPILELQAGMVYLNTRARDNEVVADDISDDEDDDVDIRNARRLARGVLPFGAVGLGVAFLAASDLCLALDGIYRHSLGTYGFYQLESLDPGMGNNHTYVRKEAAYSAFQLRLTMAVAF